MDLHGRIINLPVNTGLAMVNASDRELIAYKIGHRDARHAAADLSLNADSEHELMLTALRAILPHISTSSAAEGGPNKYSAVVAAADKVREALQAVAPRELVSG